MTEFAYANIPIPMDTAGERYFPYPGSYLLFQDARYMSQAGRPKEPDALLNIKIGKQGGGDYAVWEINNRARGSFEGFTVSWDAMPGVTAFVYVSQGPNALELESPPAKQLVTSAVGGGLDNSAASVGTSATLLSAADDGRQSVTIQNNDASVDLYIGGSGVTTSNGIKIPAGGSMALDKTTAAVYGIVGSGTINVRVMEENS